MFVNTRIVPKSVVAGATHNDTKLTFNIIGLSGRA